MNEQQLLIDANKKKSELKLISDAVCKIKAGKLAARRSIEDKLSSKRLEDDFNLSC